MEHRIGVYICHCGGNISDYVDCERVRDEIAGEADVEVAETTMFACSDAAQQGIIDDIQGHQLDAIVVASQSSIATRIFFTYQHSILTVNLSLPSSYGRVRALAYV